MLQKYLVLNTCILFAWIHAGAGQRGYDVNISPQPVCQGSSVSISCPSGYSITINDVIHGRLDDTTCVNDVMADLSNIPCENEGAGVLLRNLCDGQETCRVTPEDIETANPCIGLQPYLQYNYTCSVSIQTRSACAEEAITLTCPAGTYLHITDAFYGRNDDMRCGYTDPVSIPCSAQDARDRVANLCNSKDECLVAATEGFFGDPCEGVAKYLDVSYFCADCTNYDTSCERDATLGQCEENFARMTAYCRATCWQCRSRELDTCIDKDTDVAGSPEMCDTWASAGDCTNTFQNWMEENCTRACNKCPPDCRDIHTSQAECEQWAQDGDCMNEEYRLWMGANCRKSCGLCDEEGCLAVNKLTDENCDFWTRIGECDRNRNWMMSNCAKACTCPVQNGPILTHSDRAVDITPRQDEGILKDIIRPGYGQDYPPNGAVMYTHYYGRLENGSRFDASRFRGHMFEFSLGTRFVILGWDFGLPAMKMGEVAILYIKPEYAYGDQGFHDVIPPGATLVHETQVYGWRDTCSNYEDEELCEVYKSNGGCEANYWTRLECKRTCNLCDIPDTCVNIHGNDTECDVRARAGECDMGDALWMLENCARSCAHCPEESLDPCRDVHPVKSNCEYWKSIGECEATESAPFMNGSCRLTCGFCTPLQPEPTDDTCVNVYNDNEQCGIWARDGECVKPSQKEWMNANCAQSCNNCHKGMCTNALADDQCDYWVSQGECEGNRDWMSRNCRQSCQRCIDYDSSVYIDVTSDGNGGVLKRIIREGYGTETPTAGSVVYTHYHGILVNGSIFSTSRDNQDKMWIFQPGLESPQAIAGWEFAIPTMRRGEVSEIAIQSEYAYGSRGNNDIPPNAILIITIELYDWRETCSNIYEATTCDSRASAGECDSDPDYMNLYCKRSCNTCNQPDSCQNLRPDEDCDFWANIGECDLNQDWMVTNCARSCGLCGHETDCKNTHQHIEDCYYWRSQNECASSATARWMEANCKQTCEFCDSVCSNIENDTSCDEWAATGECNRNFDWMTVNCQLSCDRCDEDIGCTSVNLYEDDKICDTWAQDGQCESNPDFMLDQCARSCDDGCGPIQCVNNYNLCYDWANDGDCQNNYGWMLLNCARTCYPSCNDMGEGACTNQDYRCNAWAQNGECEANPDWMIQNCPQSCDPACPITPNVTTETTPMPSSTMEPTTEPGTEGQCVNNFESCFAWANDGECEDRFDWMMSNCARACDPVCNDMGEGACANQDHRCNAWAQNGECEANTDWMIQNCPQSCDPACPIIPDVTTDSTPPPSSTSEPTAEPVTEATTASSPPSTSTPEPTPPPQESREDCFNIGEDADCDRRAAEGQCLSDYMMMNCRKSCFVCVTSDFDYCFNNYTQIDQSSCEHYNSIGECTRSDSSRQWMLTFCRKQCAECADAMPHSKHTVCDGGQLLMQCDPGYYIHTKRVFYGRKDYTTCATNQMLTNDCESPDVADVVARHCNGRMSCWFPATTSVWSDACPGTDKYAHVEYTCLRCSNVYNDQLCGSMSNDGLCGEETGLTMNSCFKTCSGCSSETDDCMNTDSEEMCDREAMSGMCDDAGVRQRCARSCRTCGMTAEDTTTTTSTTTSTTTTMESTTTTTTTAAPSMSTSTTPRALTGEESRCMDNACVHGQCVSPGLTDYLDGMQYRCVCEIEYTGVYCNYLKTTACDWCSGSNRLCVTSVSSVYGSFCYDRYTWDYIPHPSE